MKNSILKLIILTIGAVACSKTAPAKQQPAVPVRVTPASRIDAPITVAASGVVEPTQTVAVTTQVSGALLSVDFKEGDYVKKGQVLFHVDPRPARAALDQAHAVLARDEAQADAGHRDDDRYKKLADMGYVSREQSDQMHATALAQAATVVADRAAIRSAQLDLDYTTIRATIAGRTGSLLVRQGNNVAPSSGPLVVINQLSPVLVRFPVLESDFAPMQRAVAQHPLDVTASTNDSSEVDERGTLSFLDNAVDSLTGTVTGKASFPNFGRRMWPGELVYLTIQLQVERGVVAVPTEAIQTGQQGSFVFVVDAKNTAQSRPVVPGIQVGDMTVVQRGVNAGDKVVIDGQSRLNPGSRVALAAGANGGRGGATGTDTTNASLSVNGEATTNGSAAGDVAGGAVGSTAQGGSRAGGSSPIVTTNTPAQLPAVAPAPSTGSATPATGTTPTAPATNPTSTPVTRPTTPTTPTAPTSPAGRPPTSTTGRGGTGA